MGNTTQGIGNESHRFEALFNHASVGIVVVNSKAEIQSVNPFALKLFGYAMEELIGSKIEVLIPNRFHHNHVKDRDAYKINPKSRPMGLGLDLFAIKKSGEEFPIEISLGNYDYNGEKYVIAFVNDITVRKRAEKEVEKLNNDLEGTIEQRTKQLTDAMHQLEKSKEELSKSLEKEKELNELKSRFVSMASHEFRTPLSTILSSASLVAKYTETNQQENRTKHIDRIKASVNSLVDLLNEFLSIGKIEDGKISANIISFNVKVLMEAVCKEMQALAKPGQKIVYMHAGDETVQLDPSLLKNVILNLLSNAIKFSSDKGLISVNSLITNELFSITVKDSGIGISDEDQDHLFERFFRARNAVNIQGTGLGLHIVNKYIEMMNGQITCKSELGNGTEFIIQFNTV
jgi:PAS domain S-box-containing protein